MEFITLLQICYFAFLIIMILNQFSLNSILAENNQLSMKILLTLLLLTLPIITMAQEKGDDEPQFSMQKYYFVFLNSAMNGPKLDSATTADIQKGHLDNITKMWKEGKCKLAGPFLDNSNMRGILIMDVASEDEVRELLKNDPAITNGLLAIEIKPWYGPVGLKVDPD